MRFFPLSILLCCLVSAVPADSVEGLRRTYLAMRNQYQEEVEEVQRDVAARERDILNRFIVSLVRMERSYQEEGDLDAMLVVRNLREALIDAPVFPEPEPAFPPLLTEAISQIAAEREAVKTEGGEALREVNRRFARRLEPVMRDLTRAGDFETARSILQVRRTIFGEIGEEQEPAQTVQPRNLGAATDPNVFPFSFEPASVGRVAGLIPRRTQIPFQPVITGTVREQPKSFQFRDGKIRVPETAMDALVFQARQNQMLTIEIGYQTHRGHQGTHEGYGPAPLFYFGSSLEDANVALTHEGLSLILYLRTDRPPSQGTHHRVNLGRIATGRMAHLMVTYRSGELTVYHDGTETLKLRGEVTGGLENWERAPLHMGGARQGGPRIEDVFWNGDIVWLYLRAGHESGRGAGAAYSRYSDFFHRPIQSP